jgi:hypothetical protein
MNLAPDTLAPAVPPALRRPARSDGGVWVAQPCDRCGQAVALDAVYRTPNGAEHVACPLDMLDHLDRLRERFNRRRPCCAPEMCPQCFDHGGHASSIRPR